MSVNRPQGRTVVIVKPHRDHTTVVPAVSLPIASHGLSELVRAHLDRVLLGDAGHRSILSDCEGQRQDKRNDDHDENERPLIVVAHCGSPGSAGLLAPLRSIPSTVRSLTGNAPELQATLIGTGIRHDVQLKRLTVQP